jgi:hypothetical protein
MTNIILENRKHNPVNKDSILEVMSSIMNQDKVASLLGFTKRQLIIRRDTEHWIKSRKNAGMGLLGRMEEIDLARSIFKAWDLDESGYLSSEELNEYMITLGLATDKVFSAQLL